MSPQQVSQLEAFIVDQTQNDPRWKPATVVQKRSVPAHAPARLASIERQASLLAALLIVIVVAGGAFALFSARHTPNSSGVHPSGTFYAVSFTGTVFAVDADSGKTIWSTPLHIKTSEQFLVSDGKIFLGSSDYFLYALQASNGQVLWKRSYKDLTTIGKQTVQIAPYPVSDGGAIYFGTPKGISAWRASDGQQLWSYPVPTNCGTVWGGCTPEVEAVTSGVVYAYLDGLYALNATDGTKLWDDLHVSSTTLVVARTHIYVASYGGAANATGPMRVLQARTGKLLSTPDLPQVEPFEMITDGNTIYLRSGNSSKSEDVYALRSADNTVLWHRYYDGLSFSSVHDGSLYATTETIAMPGSNVPSSQATHVTTTNGGSIILRFCALSATDGSTQWCRPLSSNFGLVGKMPVVSQGTLYMIAESKVEAIGLSDGKVLWEALENVSLAYIELA
jgi:outer membrane protein assembly factor BamB